MPDFVDLENVTVIRGERTVLHGVGLRIAAGEQIALLGPNGCGKSTLLKVICCELHPLAMAETRVMLLGRERWDLTELRKQLGVVQAEIPGKPMLAVSGFDAVMTGFFSSSTLWPHLKISDAMRDGVAGVLRRVGGEGLAGKVFGEMSAGQQRRVLIGRALVASAGCLLLDEPSNALDLYAQAELRELLVELAEQGTTMLLITHQLADIIPAMKRVVMMKEGRIVADGQRTELLTEDRLSELFGKKVWLSERGEYLHAW